MSGAGAEYYASAEGMAQTMQLAREQDQVFGEVDIAEATSDAAVYDYVGYEAEKTKWLTDRLFESFSVCLAATLCLILGEITFNYSRARLIPEIQVSTSLLLAVLLWMLRRRPARPTVIAIAWVGLGSMSFGTAIIGTVDQEAFSASGLAIALSMTAATLLPWGMRAQIGAVLPMALAYAFLLFMVDSPSGWGPRMPLGVAMVFAASIYVAHHLERERSAVTRERRRRAAENSRLLSELKRANEVKSEFVATMSHELRTPISVILGYNELLADGSIGDPTAAQKDALGRIQANALELLELVNATLDLNRLEAASVSIQAQTFQLAQLADEIDAQVRMLRADGVQLRWQLPPDLAPVCSDVAKLKVILKNLTTNALKFTKRGSVTVSFDVTDDELQIEITDTGIGMSAEAVQIVFNPFQQADASIQRDFGGAGLGLHIVKRLVTLLGGTIDLQSELGRGTTFRVRLPHLKPGAAPAAHVAESHPNPST